MPVNNHHITALIVEANAHDLITLSGLLTDLGVRYKRNTTGANVLSQLDAMQPPPAFIFLNVSLPHGDSFAICRAIHAERAMSSIPVIAVGGDELHRQTRRLKNAGFAGVITKPFPRKTLGETLSTLLRAGSLWESASHEV